MFQTTGDILNIVLAVGIGVLAVFFVIVLYHFIFILLNLRKITSRARETVDIVNRIAYQPLKFLNQLMKQSGKIIDIVEDKVKTKGKKKRKK